MENEKIGFKIDAKKWKQDLEVLLKQKEDWQQARELFLKTNDYKLYVSYVDWDDKLTKHYSIRAHARGKLHRQRARLNAYEYKQLGYVPEYKKFIENNGAIIVPLTIIDQAKYIDDNWKEYEVKE